MKKKFIVISLLLLSVVAIAFAVVPILTEHESATSRFRHSIDQTFYTTVSPTSATLYYGLSTSSVTPASVELQIASNPNFTSQGSKSVSSSDTFKSFHADGLDPAVSYNLYTVLIDDGGEESSVFSKVIPSINYVTNAVYIANEYLDATDDKIILKFNDDFAYSPGYTTFDIHVGYFNITDYESIAINPPSEGALNPITVLSNGSFSSIVNLDSKTIELTIDSTALALYNTESQWLVNNPTFARVQVNDTNSATTFEMDGGLYFMPMTYASITTETYPELTAFKYQNASGIASDTMKLIFNQSISESTITSNDIVISFDDISGGSYNTADSTLVSADFTKTITGSSIIIDFTSTGVDKIKLLQSDTIANVQINDNVPNSFIIDPVKNNKTLIMPGQNSDLNDLKLHNRTIKSFTPTQYSYYLDISSKDYSEVAANPLEFLTYVAMDSNASVTVTAPSVAIYGIDITSQDTNETSTYSVDLSRLETRLTDIQVNGTSIDGFSLDTYEYTFNIDDTFRVTDVTADAFDQGSTYTINYSGSQPGTYVVSITVESASDVSVTNDYKLNYVSPVAAPPSTSSSSSSSSSSTTTTANTEPVETTKSTKQLATNVTANIDKLIANEDKLDDPETIDKLISTLYELTSGVDTREEAIQATNDLLKLTDTLSKKILETDGNKENVLILLEEIGKSMAGVISKFDNPDDKIKQIKSFTDSLKEVKNSGLKTTVLDKSISDILNDTARSLNSTKITKSVLTSDNKKIFVINEDIIGKTDSDSNKKLNELKKLADEYFEEENYIDIKKEVEFSIESTDDITNIVLDKAAIKRLKSSSVNTVNIKVGDTTIALPIELLNSSDNYQLVVKKLSQTSQLIREEKVKTNVKALTNNKKYVDISIFKNGTKLADLEKPIELRLETSHFGIEDIDSKTETLIILRYNDETGIWQPVGGIYDPISKTISVHRIHLSKYTVMKTKKTITDVENEDVKSEVLSLLNKGVITDTKGNMKDNITREEFVTWLGKSYGLTSLTATTPFEDLDPDSESYKFVATVYEQGIISGKSNDTFGTGDFMTYEELAVILSNTLTTLDNKKINNNLTKKLSQMGADINVSDWAKDEMALIIELGILDDSIALNADGYITREEAAAIFDKFYS